MSNRTPNYIRTLRPAGNDSKSLFEFCVSRAIDKRVINDEKTHLQWATLVFDYEKSSALRKDYMSKVKCDFGIYFTSGNSKYGFEIEKIKRHFPYLFGLPSSSNNVSDDEDEYTLDDYFEDMQNALAEEVKEQSNPHNMELFKIKRLDFIAQTSGVYIHRATLDLDGDSTPNFSEGIPFFLKMNGVKHACEAIEYDAVNEQLFFTAAKRLYFIPKAFIIQDTAFILQALKERLRFIAAFDLNEDYPLFKFFADETEERSLVRHGQFPRKLVAKLDASQAKAFRAALDYDITFIWGPPGTGKSFTLAAIIKALYDIGEDRTVVCCLSNVAVDQLANKVIDIVEDEGLKMKPGEFYRAGRSMDERILATDYLFPNDKETNRLRNEIKKNKEKILLLKLKRQEFSEAGIVLKAANKELYDQLKERTDFLVRKSKVVFSTISHFILNTNLHSSQFDNLIVDEASMLSFPNLVALASRVTKRIILVGDFQQLSPIAIIPNELLKDSVFKMCGINMQNTNHPALHMLLNQRRSHEKIVEMINGTFYENRLIATIHDRSVIARTGPFPKCIVALKDVKDGYVRFTKGGTRQNPRNGEAIIELLDNYLWADLLEEDTFSIGIITPYRGQVSLIRALITEEEYPENFTDRIKVGTVHTFQGSECDVIIFDTVDCSSIEGKSRANIGKIYTGDDGEHLLNVAISRARHKLIIVGEADYMKSIPGNQLKNSTIKIFRQFYNLRFTQE